MECSIDKMSIILQDYNFTVVPISGKKNWLTDTLSRAPANLQPEAHIVHYHQDVEIMKEKILVNTLKDMQVITYKGSSTKQ